MTTATKPDLLQACIHDLYAARRCARDGLPEVARAAREKLRRAMESILDTYAEDCAAFEDSDNDLSGPENLWMAGVVKDAQRDTRTVEPGPLLDTALIGAVRKGLAADIVSLETGMAVAEALERKSDREMLATMHASARKHDEALRTLLGETA